jgi:hypothetical protein
LAAPQKNANGVYEGSTNFGALSGGGAPAAGKIDPSWKPNPKDPYAVPPGISPSFWNDVLNGAMGPNSGNMAGAWKKDPVGMITGTYKNYALPQWQNMSPQKQKMFTDQDASGNPYSVGTAEADLWNKQKDVTDVRDTNQQEFSQWEADFLPGVREAMAGAQAGDADALAKLKETLDGIKDPEIAKFVGDYVSQGATAAADPRDIEAQQRQLAKLEGLSDPSITAEEKLMMEMSRRQTEGDLRAQRGALTNDLQARGMYGSGQELTQNMMAGSEAASRHALELLGAQSNASKRAMEALKGAGDLSTSMRDSGAKESQFRGTAADRAAEFNNNLRESYNQWKTEQEAERNKDRERRGATAFDATTGVNSDTVKDSLAVADLGLKKSMGATGQLTGDTVPVSAGFKDQAALDQLNKDKKELADL